MIRYLNGDVAVARAYTPCACGRGLERIGPIEGRTTDTLRDRNGDPVNGLVFNILFGVSAHVARKFQVIQRRDNSIVMKVVPNVGDRLPSFDDGRIRAFAAQYLPGVPFAIEYVDDIPLSGAGKRKVVVVEPPT
jgi:phenylacetate-CoA ligase